MGSSVFTIFQAFPSFPSAKSPPPSVLSVADDRLENVFVVLSIRRRTANILPEAARLQDRGIRFATGQVRYSGGTGRVVVAHRLSTLRNADRIFVFDQGRIVATGTYAELLDRGGIFAELAHAANPEAPAHTTADSPQECLATVPA